jgi:hypothetical protein
MNVFILHVIHVLLYHTEMAPQWVIIFLNTAVKVLADGLLFHPSKR